MGFAALIFTSLIRISSLDTKSRHGTLLAERCPLKATKALIWRKVVPLATIILAAEARQLAHPSCLSARDGFRRNLNVNVWLILPREQEIS